jgi:excisionase family DNA binding protein
MTPVLLTVDEAAARLHQAKKTIRNWLALRRLDKVRVGRTALIPESEIARILAEGFIPARGRGPAPKPLAAAAARLRAVGRR